MRNPSNRSLQNEFDARRRQVSRDEAATDAGDRRQESRQMARQHVALSFRSFRMICDLIDLSESGAKISVVDGVVPNEREDVALTLFDGTIIEGRVSALRDQYIALEFAAPIFEVADRLDFESLGSAYFGKAVALQKLKRR